MFNREVFTVDQLEPMNSDVLSPDIPGRIISIPNSVSCRSENINWFKIRIRDNNSPEDNLKSQKLSSTDYHYTNHRNYYEEPIQVN